MDETEEFGVGGGIYADEDGRIFDAETAYIIEQLERLANRAPPGWSRHTLGERELQRNRRKYCGYTRPCPFPRYMSPRRG